MNFIRIVVGAVLSKDETLKLTSLKIIDKLSTYKYFTKQISDFGVFSALLRGLDSSTSMEATDQICKSFWNLLDTGAELRSQDLALISDALLNEQNNLPKMSIIIPTLLRIISKEGPDWKKIRKPEIIVPLEKFSTSPTVLSLSKNDPEADKQQIEDLQELKTVAKALASALRENEIRKEFFTSVKQV